MGSGAAMAGLVHTLGADRVLGVDCGAVGDPERVVSDSVAGLATDAREPRPLRLRRDQVGAGYGGAHRGRGGRRLPGFFGHRQALSRAQDAVVASSTNHGTLNGSLHGPGEDRS